MADTGIDVDILAERLQRQGAGRYGADWAALLAVIGEKASQSLKAVPKPCRPEGGDALSSRNGYLFRGSGS
jgi:hypothetical protein